MALAGLAPDRTPLDVYIDAEWAALCDLIGPGEHVLEAWSDLTGEPVDAARRSGDDDHGGDPEAAQALRALDDEELARWVPAYRRVLDGEASDDEMDLIDAAWSHTAGYAAGQSALVKNNADATGKRRSVTEAPAPAAPAGPAFGMPPGMGGAS